MTQPHQPTDLLKVISRLTVVLEREIDMLRAMKPAEVQTLHQDKLVLSAAYEAHIKALSERPELLDSMAPHLRGEVKDAVARFQVALAENERRLHAARDVTERVLRAIADELDRRRLDTRAYSAGGVMQAPPRRAAGRPLCVTLDRRL